MVRHRRRYRRAIAIPRPKYSSETIALNLTLNNNGQAQDVYAQGNSVLIPPITAFGRRKCKYFTLRVKALNTLVNNVSIGYAMIQFVLVFVPEGTTPSLIQSSVPTALSSMYEPNQNVIISGICDSTQVYTFRSRLSRNLNSNDSLFFIARDLTTNGNTANPVITPISITFNYAITF